MCARNTRPRQALRVLVFTALIPSLAFAASTTPVSSAEDRELTTEVPQTNPNNEPAQHNELEGLRNQTTALVALGVASATGNTKIRALVASSRLKARRGDNQLRFNLAIASFDSARDPKQDLEPTMRNAYGALRYDRFLGKGFTALWGQSARTDRFQGLLLRMNLDIGCAYYFVDTVTQSLWTEATIDFQKDWRRLDAIVRTEKKGTPVSQTAHQYGGRLFVAYEGQFTENLSLMTDFEYVQSMEASKAFHINWGTSLSSAIRNSLSLAVVYELRYDHAPLPTVLRTDGLLTANLVYRLR